MQVYPGMVLRVWSRRKGVYHYGIASYNNLVIDHAPRKGTAIRQWEEFTEGEQVEIVPRKEGDFPAHIIHIRAFNQIGKNTYSVFGLNCEHFASWCMRNKAESLQVREKVIGAAVLGGVAFLGYKLIRYLIKEDDEETTD